MSEAETAADTLAPTGMRLGRVLVTSVAAGIIWFPARGWLSPGMALAAIAAMCIYAGTLVALMSRRGDARSTSLTGVAVLIVCAAIDVAGDHALFRVPVVFLELLYMVPFAALLGWVGGLWVKACRC